MLRKTAPKGAVLLCLVGYTVGVHILNFFRKKQTSLRIGTFGMLNNPEYRQELWREAIANRLECFDVVCLVCGHEPDLALLAKAFPAEWQSGKLKAVYKHWSFPEWSYEELAKHLQTALELARAQDCAWMIKLDIDTVFHEKDMARVRDAVHTADRKGKWLVSFRKLQFFMPSRYWRKGSVPFGINMASPVAYGFDQNRYTDLCQPIIWDGSTTVTHNGKQYDIPLGTTVPSNKIYTVNNIHLFNYDFTFRTYERSIELLYQIEMAHARFWGKGYTGLPIDSITRESSMRDFLALSQERFSRMHKTMKIEEHPRHFQEALRTLKPDQWGFGLWDKILL